MNMTICWNANENNDRRGKTNKLLFHWISQREMTSSTIAGMYEKIQYNKIYEFHKRVLSKAGLDEHTCESVSLVVETSIRWTLTALDCCRITPVLH